MKQLKDYTSEKYIRKIRAKNKYKAIEELARVFSETGVCDNIDELIGALIEREKIMSTGIGFGLAIPHAKIKSVNEISFAIGISKNGIEYDSIDGKPVNLIILVAAGERQHKEYLKLLSRIMSILKDEAVREKVINFGSANEILRTFALDMEQ